MQLPMLADMSFEGFEKGITLGTVIAGLLVGGFTYIRTWWKKRSKERKEGTNFEEMSRYDIQIHDLLTEARGIAEAQRGAIKQFHNGDRFFSGTPIQKITCTHESVAGGYADLAKIQIAVPLSLLTPIMKIMLDSPGTIHTIGDLAESYVKSDMMSIGVHSICVIPLKSRNHSGLPDKIIAYMTLDWVNSGPPETIMTARLARILAISHQIEAILENQRLAMRH